MKCLGLHCGIQHFHDQLQPVVKVPVSRCGDAPIGKIDAKVLVRLARRPASEAIKVIPVWSRITPSSFSNVRADRLHLVPKLAPVNQQQLLVSKQSVDFIGNGASHFENAEGVVHPAKLPRIRKSPLSKSRSCNPSIPRSSNPLF